MLFVNLFSRYFVRSPEVLLCSWFCKDFVFFQFRSLSFITVNSLFFRHPCNLDECMVVLLPKLLL